jgi:hypothetical protein
LDFCPLPATNNRLPTTNRAANRPNDQARIDFEIVDAHRALATLGLHYERHCCRFQRLGPPLEVQSERRHEQERDLRRAAVP